MPSKKKTPSGSDGANARRRRQAAEMPGAPAEEGSAGGMGGAATAETPVLLGMSGEEEMPGAETMDAAYDSGEMTGEVTSPPPSLP